MRRDRVDAPSRRLGWALVGALVALACGWPTVPPPPPQADYADEAMAWCQGTPFFSDRCGTLKGSAPPTGLYVGLSFDAATPAGPAPAPGVLSVLSVGAGGTYSVGGLIAPFGSMDAMEQAEDAVRACITGPCPQGPELPPLIFDLVQKPQGQVGRDVQDGSGHVHAMTEAGHGYPRRFDIVRSDQGDGWWIAAVGTPPYPMKTVALFLPVAPRRGPEPPPDLDFADLAAAWCGGVPALAATCGQLQEAPIAFGTYVGLAFAAGSADPLASPELSILRVRKGTASILATVPDDGRKRYTKAMNELRACLLQGCPDGPELPEGIEYWAHSQARLLYGPTATAAGHLHGDHVVDGRHVERVDFATSSHPGVWVAAVGTSPDHLVAVSVHVKLPDRELSR